MGIMRRISICVMLFGIIMFLSACEDNFYTADISMYDIELSEVQAHSGAAYYLSKEGTLYCTGADSDSASFVVYQNSEKGIVAENVKNFHEFTGGGYYIDRNNDLYMWNEDIMPHYGYDKRAEHMLILEDVKFAVINTQCLIYIDLNSNLYLAGTLGDEVHSITNPKQLANDVVCADLNNGTILWAEIDGNIGSYGNTDAVMLSELNAQFNRSNVTDIRLEGDYVAILSNRQLWYYGDYQKLISGEASQNIGLRMLSSDIVSISCSVRTIAALDTGGKALLWGRCISNDAQNTKLPQFSYYEAFCLTESAENVFVSDSCICYIDKNGKSNIFYSSSWPVFYGNSTKDPCVGIKRDPSTWIK